MQNVLAPEIIGAVVLPYLINFHDKDQVKELQQCTDNGAWWDGLRAILTKACPRRIKLDFWCRSLVQGDIKQCSWIQNCIRVTEDEYMDRFPEICASGNLDSAKWMCKFLPEPANLTGTLMVYDALHMACTEGHDNMVDWLIKYFSIRSVSTRRKFMIVETFERVCQGGYLYIAQKLQETFSLTRDDVASCLSQVLECVCNKGFLNVAQWLAGAFSITQSEFLDDGLESACSKGHLNVVEWLLREVKEYDKKAFASACIFGHTDVAKWLNRLHALPLTEENVDWLNGLFRMVCENGHLDTAKWIFEAFIAAHGYPRSECLDVFSNVCKKGHLPVARWLYESFPFIKEKMADAFKEACKNGHLGTAKWIFENSWIHLDDKLYILQHITIHGYLQLAQWLHSTFGLQEAVKLEKNALFTACGYGHLNMAKWLLKNFPESKQSVKEWGRSVLCHACVAGDLRTTKWMTGMFGITLADISKFTMYSACCYGRLNMAKWLQATYSIKRFEQMREIFIPACEGGFLSILQWLTETFDLKEDFINSKDHLFKAACKYGQLEIAEWYYTRFGMTDRAIMYDGFMQTSINGHSHVAKWLYRTFSIPQSVCTDLIGRLIKGDYSHKVWQTVEWLIEITGESV